MLQLRTSPVLAEDISDMAEELRTSHHPTPAPSRCTFRDLCCLHPKKKKKGIKSKRGIKTQHREAVSSRSLLRTKSSAHRGTGGRAPRQRRDAQLTGSKTRRRLFLFKTKKKKQTKTRPQGDGETAAAANRCPSGPAARGGGPEGGGSRREGRCVCVCGETRPCEAERALRRGQALDESILPVVGGRGCEERSHLSRSVSAKLTKSCQFCIELKAVLSSTRKPRLLRCGAAGSGLSAFPLFPPLHSPVLRWYAPGAVAAVLPAPPPERCIAVAMALCGRSLLLRPSPRPSTRRPRAAEAFVR